MNRTRSSFAASFSAVGLLVCVAWALSAWLVSPAHGGLWAPSALWHKVASVILATSLAIHLFLVVTFEQSD